jgi:streptomycin 6-kinase
MDKRIFEKYADLWELIPIGKTLETPTSILHFVSYKMQPAVLKLFKPNSDEKNSSRILAQYQGNGAVKVFRASEDAVLLERTNSARHLSDLVLENRDDQATNIFCEIAKKLHASQYETDIAEPVASLDRVFDSTAADDQIIPSETRRKARKIYRWLCDTQKSPVLLHGDLHHDNILYDDARGWLSIDPKGYIGEAEFEVAAFLKNPKHNRYFSDKNIINQRIAVIIKSMNLNATRIILWSYCYYVISGIWSIEDGDFKEEWFVMLSVLEDMTASHAAL